MAPWSFLPALLFLAWVAGGEINIMPCQFCDDDAFRICPTNPSSELGYSMKITPPGALLLQCQPSLKTLNQTEFEKCSFPFINKVEFYGCPFPETSFGEFLSQTGVLPENVSSLHLHGHNIDSEEYLKDWHFEGLDNLEFLEIRGRGLNTLPAKIFMTLRNLKTLKLVSNNLEYLPESLFAMNKELTTIDFMNNSLTDMHEDVFSNLTHLSNISFSNNYIRDIPPNFFSDFSELLDINLSNNNITYLDRSLFQDLRELKSLDLQGNPLTTLPANVFADLVELEDLNLRSINIEALPSSVFEYLRKLKNLDLSYNSLHELPDRLFQRCRSLETLLLSHNNLESLISTTFPSHSVTSLTYLDLGYNNLSFPRKPYYVFGDMFPLSTQVKLKKLYLNNNRIDSVPSAINEVFIQLETVDLSGNEIRYLDFYSLFFHNDDVTFNVENNDIRLVDLKDAWMNPEEKIVRLTLKGNSLVCNCLLYRFLRMAQGHTVRQVGQLKLIVKDIGDVSCTSANNKSQKLLDVCTECLTCNLNYRIGNCTCLWRSHDEMMIIDCSYLGLQEIPVPEAHEMSTFNPRNSSITLNLNNNSLANLDVLQEPQYATVVNLSLANNKLSFINESYFPEKLKVLDLRGNNLTTMDESLLDFLNATDITLSLGRNPWICDCSAIQMLNFLHVPSRKVLDFNDIRCSGEETSLMEMTENTLCPFFMQPMVIVTIVAITIFLLLFAVLGTVSFYKYNQGIKIWLFTHHMCLWAITEDELDVDKKYDAFISYSHKDEEFVNTVLVPGLESGDPKYRICLHYRDWIPGEYIQNQIMQSVEASRRTIVVLSSNFIESIWGQLEFKAAHSQALQDKTNRIIVIVYGEVPPESELDEKLQLYISMRTYVKWGDEKFWEKLRNVMPHPQHILNKTRKRCDTDKLELVKSNSKQSV